jgi:hypothetical protein
MIRSLDVPELPSGGVKTRRAKTQWEKGNGRESYRARQVPTFYLLFVGGCGGAGCFVDLYRIDVVCDMISIEILPSLNGKECRLASFSSGVGLRRSRGRGWVGD